MLPSAIYRYGTASALAASLTLSMPAWAAKPDRLAQAPAAPNASAASSTTAANPAASAPAADLTMATFLDRLMLAESGGREDARNPLSTAVGPFQFIESTWLDMVRRHFAAETQALTHVQVLALRTDRAFSRRAAEIYTRENGASLKAAGVEPTFPHLRLAFLLGAGGAIRVLQAPADTRVTLLLGPAVARANPFLYGMTAEALIARAARDLAVPRATLAALAPGEMSAAVAGPPRPRPPRVVVRCNLDLPACRRWQSLALARLPAEKPARRQTVAKGR
jgi:hypothetical protein